MYSYLLLIDTYGLSLTVLSYLAGPKSVSAACPPPHPAQIRDSYRFKSLDFVKRQKLINIDRVMHLGVSGGKNYIRLTLLNLVVHFFSCSHRNCLFTQATLFP